MDNSKYDNREIVLIPVEKVVPSPFQPRINFDEKSILELASSIKQLGVIQPIVVRKRNGLYELIAGERRLEAVKFLKWGKIPAIVKNVSDIDAFRMAVSENLKREDLNPLEVAGAIKNMKERFRLTDKQVAEMLGMSRPQVTNYLRILNLPEKIKSALRSGEISFGHARSLLSVSESDAIKLYKKILKSHLSVRDTEKLAKKFSQKETVIAQTEELLTKSLGTKVKIIGSKKRGELRISYFSEDELADIVKKLAGS